MAQLRLESQHPRQLDYRQRSQDWRMQPAILNQLTTGRPKTQESNLAGNE